MRFRCVLVVHTTYRLLAPWTITFPGSSNKVVLCRDLTADEIHNRRGKEPGLYIEASANFNVRPRINALLASLEERHVPYDISSDDATQRSFASTY